MTCCTTLPWQFIGFDICMNICIYCRDGAERSGLLCVVSVVLERMKVEQDIAIGHVIKELWSCREQIIPSLVSFPNTF